MFKGKKIVSVFLLALYVGYYASTHFFVHTHKFTFGTVSHSHLHTDSHHDTKSGGHTKQSITFIDQISHFEYLDFSCNYVFTSQQFQTHQQKFIETVHWITSIYLQNLSLRAPPVKLL